MSPKFLILQYLIFLEGFVVRHPASSFPVFENIGSGILNLRKNAIPAPRDRQPFLGRDRFGLLALSLAYPVVHSLPR